MDSVFDFTNDPRIFRSLGGSDRKIMVNHNGENYMLKFSEGLDPHTDMTDSYANNVISEYISSHIAETMGIPVHKTVMGQFKDETVVGCKDFRLPGEENIEFQEFVHAVFNSSDVKRVIRLDQVYATLDDKTAFSPLLRNLSVERYWDTFIVDALVGNFDRHIGNWGYLSNGEQIKLAPVYDFGSTLLPKLSDDGIDEIATNRFEMMKRCLVYPSPALFILSEKAGKVGFYDLIASGYDKNCTEAVKRVYPRIDIEKIKDVIRNTPLITDKRRDFYCEYVALRKELILDRAYKRVINNNFDKEAMDRIKMGHQYSVDDLKRDMNNTEVIFADTVKRYTECLLPHPEQVFAANKIEKAKERSEGAAIYRNKIKDMLNKNAIDEKTAIKIATDNAPRKIAEQIISIIKEFSRDRDHDGHSDPEL